MRLTADELRTRAKVLAQESQACIELADGMDRYRKLIGAELVVTREDAPVQHGRVAIKERQPQRIGHSGPPVVIGSDVEAYSAETIHDELVDSLIAEYPNADLATPVLSVAHIPPTEVAPSADAEPPANAPDDNSISGVAKHIKALSRPSGWAIEDDCDLIRFVNLGWKANEIAQDLGRDTQFVMARMQALYGRKKPHDPPAYTFADLQAAALELTFTAQK